MSELKAAKKAKVAIVGGVVDGKPKTTKTMATTAAKTQAIKKTVLESKAIKNPVAKTMAMKSSEAVMAEPKRTTTNAVKKVPTLAAEKKDSVKKVKSARAELVDTQKLVAKLSSEERYRMVETTAYFIAERHGFKGSSDEHWAAAEREIASKLDYRINS